MLLLLDPDGRGSQPLVSRRRRRGHPPARHRVGAPVIIPTCSPLCVISQESDRAVHGYIQKFQIIIINQPTIVREVWFPVRKRSVFFLITILDIRFEGRFIFILFQCKIN